MNLLKFTHSHPQYYQDLRKTYHCDEDTPTIMGLGRHADERRQRLIDYKLEINPKLLADTQKKVVDLSVSQVRRRLEIDRGESFTACVARTTRCIDSKLISLAAAIQGLAGHVRGGDILYCIEYTPRNFDMVVDTRLHPADVWRIEHQLLVSHSEYAMVYCSDGTEKNTAHMIYHSDPARRLELLKALSQFDLDLAFFKLLKNMNPSEVIKASNAWASQCVSAPATSTMVDWDVARGDQSVVVWSVKSSCPACLLVNQFRVSEEVQRSLCEHMLGMPTGRTHSVACHGCGEHYSLENVLYPGKAL